MTGTFGGISSHVEIIIIKKSATEGDLYCFLDVCMLWYYKRERNQREISTAPLKQFLLHKHLKGLLAKKLLLQNTQHIGKENLSKIQSCYFFSMTTTTSRPSGLLFWRQPSASFLRCQLSAQLLRFPQQEKLHQTGNAAESSQLIGRYRCGLWKPTGA